MKECACGERYLPGDFQEFANDEGATLAVIAICDMCGDAMSYSRPETEAEFRAMIKTEQDAVEASDAQAPPKP
jgi:hypothetical protein